MSSSKLLYSVVARGYVVLAEHSVVQGNAHLLAVRILEKLNQAEDTRVSYSQVRASSLTGSKLCRTHKAKQASTESMPCVMPMCNALLAMCRSGTCSMCWSRTVSRSWW